MPYIPADMVSRAKQMDLYTYLHDYEPQELVHLGSGTYCSREHDSLKISNGGGNNRRALRRAAGCRCTTKGAAEAVSASARGQR